MMDRAERHAEGFAERIDGQHTGRHVEGRADKLIDEALQEDLGEAGDVTSTALFRDEIRTLVLVSKETGILAGLDIFCRVFHRTDPDTRITCLFRDGDEIHPGDAVCEITGRAASLLSAERVALNFLSFLSGVATATRAYVDLAERHGKAKILDTRKTLPGFRELSKYAVRVGGGENHRMGLYDMVMIKDNHIDLAGSIAQAVDAARTKWKDRYRIEVECRSLSEVTEALNAGADIIMLDNMELPDIRKAVELTHARSNLMRPDGAQPDRPQPNDALPEIPTKLEASGNVTLETVGDLSAAGVDFISVGRITHSAKAFDFSLRCRRGKGPETGVGID